MVLPTHHLLVPLPMYEEKKPEYAFVSLLTDFQAAEPVPTSDSSTASSSSSESNNENTNANSQRQ